MALWNQRLHIYAHTGKVIGSPSVLIWSSFVFLYDYNKYSKSVIKNMIHIILLVQGCRNGTGTVQNKKINLFLRDSESVAKGH